MTLAPLRFAPNRSLTPRRAQAPAGRPARAPLPGQGAAWGPARPLRTRQAEDAVFTNPTSRNQVTFHVTPEASHQAILDAIKNARSSFWVETFIWHNDAAGHEIVAALAAKKREAAARGETFDVKILIDWLGLRQGSGGYDDRAIVDQLRAIGAEVLEFSPGYVQDGMLAPITHRKFYIADGDLFVTGGRNIGNEYLKPTYPLKDGTPENSWHDLLYTVRGEETGRILKEFLENWERAGGQRPAQVPTVRPAPAGQTRIESFRTNPHTDDYELRKATKALIANARHEVLAIYPYFSDDELVNDLIAAKRKNPALAIKVLLPASKEASREGTIYSLLNKETARQLLAHGIEVRMFEGGHKDGEPIARFSHFKGMVVDRRALWLGSANGDARTFKNNHELNTLIVDPATTADFLRQVATPDWNDGVPLTLADLARESWWTRIKMHALEVLDFLL